jgi:hypothetical protein
MSPVGLVNPFRGQMRAPRLKVASRYRGGPEMRGVARDEDQKRW